MEKWMFGTNHLSFLLYSEENFLLFQFHRWIHLWLGDIWGISDSRLNRIFSIISLQIMVVSATVKISFFIRIKGSFSYRYLKNEDFYRHMNHFSINLDVCVFFTWILFESWTLTLTIMFWLIIKPLRNISETF